MAAWPYAWPSTMPAIWSSKKSRNDCEAEQSLASVRGCDTLGCQVHGAKGNVTMAYDAPLNHCQLPGWYGAHGCRDALPAPLCFRVLHSP